MVNAERRLPQAVAYLGIVADLWALPVRPCGPSSKVAMASTGSSCLYGMSAVGWKLTPLGRLEQR